MEESNFVLRKGAEIYMQAKREVKIPKAKFIAYRENRKINGAFFMRKIL